MASVTVNSVVEIAMLIVAPPGVPIVAVLAPKATVKATAMQIVTTRVMARVAVVAVVAVAVVLVVIALARIQAKAAGSVLTLKVSP